MTRSLCGSCTTDVCFNAPMAPSGRQCALHAPETDARYALLRGTHACPVPPQGLQRGHAQSPGARVRRFSSFPAVSHVRPRAGSLDVDSICEGRFDAALDKVSVISRALGRDQSPACRAEALRALARCAPVGCPVSVNAGATPHASGRRCRTPRTPAHSCALRMRTCAVSLTGTAAPCRQPSSTCRTMTPTCSWLPWTCSRASRAPGTRMSSPRSSAS